MATLKRRDKSRNKRLKKRNRKVTKKEVKLRLHSMQNGGFFDVIRAFTHLLNPSNHFLKVLYTLHAICSQNKIGSDTNQSTSNLNTFYDIKNSPYLRRQLIEKATNKGIEYFLLTETELTELKK